MKRIMSLLVIFCLVFGMVACGSSEPNEGQKTTEVTKDETESASSEVETSVPVVKEATTYPLRIEDGHNRVIEIEEEPARIISLAPSITEAIYAVGAGDKLIGRTDYCDYPVEASEVESIGSLRSPNIEKIAELEPDLVIASTHFSDEVLKKFDELEIKVIVLIAQESFDGVYEIIEKTGLVLNKNQEAYDLVSEMKTEVTALLELVKSVEKKDVYYVVGFGQYGDYTATGDTFIHNMLEMAGGNNVAKDAEGWVYSIEKLVEQDPEILIVTNKWDAATELKATAGYIDLTSVTEEKLFGINEDFLNRQGPRLVQGLKALIEIIHPEVIK